jgi:outer membrane lipoprotein-sorting protein
MSPDRRRLTLALLATALAGPLLAGPLLAGPALAQLPLRSADQDLVDAAVAYLEGLKEAKGRFVQTDARGQTTTGVLFLKRPGRARFAYDPPSGLLVVSNGRTVSVADSRLKSFDSYPLGATPLSLFLSRHISLDQGVEVVSVTRTRDGFTLVARDVRKQTAGQLALSFTQNPLRLAGWAVTDAQRRTTRVGLVELAPTSGLSPDLFVLNDPRPKGARARM